jgi:hypothetical protein
MMSGGSTTYAGGIYLESCDTVAYDTSITGNDASYCGGGIYMLDSDLYMERCEIANNTYPYNGGAIVADDYSDATLVDCDVFGSHASRTGGAFWFDIGTLTLIGGSVYDNFAADEGGGAYLSLSNVSWLTSDGTDWGTGAQDNVPDDISVYYQSGYLVGPSGDIRCDQWSCE